MPGLWKPPPPPRRFGHVAADVFKVEVGKSKEIALLMSEGVKPEQLGASQ
jgi:hypothetical protein